MNCILAIEGFHFHRHFELLLSKHFLSFELFITKKQFLNIFLTRFSIVQNFDYHFRN
jgi:hypothetical protein